MTILPKNKGNMGHASKMEREDIPKLNIVGTEFRQWMIQRRLAKHWTRKDLANHSALTENMISSYENGNAIKNDKEMNKIRKALEK